VPDASYWILSRTAKSVGTALADLKIPATDIDIVIRLDAGGSMGEEIERLKREIADSINLLGNYDGTTWLFIRLPANVGTPRRLQGQPTGVLQQQAPKTYLWPPCGGGPSARAGVLSRIWLLRQVEAELLGG